METQRLRFGFENSKLSGIHTFSLPAGKSCPFAKDCKAWATKTIVGGKPKYKLMRGKDCKFTCYAATLESIFPNVYNRNEHNFNVLRAAGTLEGMAQLIHESLPQGARIIRIHVSGDFYSEIYFLAWLNVAISNPNVIFYAYTKSLPYWIKYKRQLPSNFKLVASKGGSADYMIAKGMKTVQVVYSQEEAQQLGLPIDTDDSHAYSGDKSFALLLHGKQKAGTKAAEALRELIKKGLGKYNVDTKHTTVNPLHIAVLPKIRRTLTPK